jgi:hypothetical protein
VSSKTGQLHPGDSVSAVAPLVTALRTPAVRSSIEQLGGYVTEHAGEIETLTEERSLTG